MNKNLPKTNKEYKRIPEIEQIDYDLIFGENDQNEDEENKENKRSTDEDEELMSMLLNSKSILQNATRVKAASQADNTQQSMTMDSQTFSGTAETSPVKRRKFQEQLMNMDIDSQKFLTPRDPIKIFNSQSSTSNGSIRLNNSSNNTSDSDLLSLMNTTDDEHLFYGLPMKVKHLLADLRKISSLYEWQHELMTLMLDKYHQAMKQIQTRTFNNPCGALNLLYLSPTSGGKTLVAELLIFHTLLVRRRDCIFIMPFVSIVQEKVQMLGEFAENLNFYVEEYAGVKGMIPPVKRQQSKLKNTLYICTIEKAHSLINSLIETQRLCKEIGLVVADEMHMIGDGPRGAIYEMTLAKVKYCSQSMLKDMPDTLPIQLVATTATLDNKQELAQFLNAHLYERDFRPVELREFIKLDRQIFEVDKKKLRNLAIDEETESVFELSRELEVSNETNELKKDDPDNLVALVKEVIPEESCLVFCSTKKNCENVAMLLSRYLPVELKYHKRDLKLKLFNELKEENMNNICPTLRQSIQFGIAYHHSGLTTEERQLIEQAFRDGVLCLLTCTSTLAAGVNLPAKRVIIRSPYVAFDFISTNQYKQMIGRAGRAGLIDSTGESILVFKVQDKHRVHDLITGPMKRCDSSFQCDDSKAIRILVLSLIGLNLTHYGSQMLLFFKQTLFYLQQKENLAKETTEVNDQPIISDDDIRKRVERVSDEFNLISNALAYLLEHKLVRITSINDPSLIKTLIDNLKDPQIRKQLYYETFEVTKLGMAAIRGNIDLDYVNQLYSDLNMGLKTMVLSNYLHLLYLCTPYDLVNSLNNVDLDTYCSKYCNLKDDEVKCAQLIGIHEDYLRKRKLNQTTSKKVNENVFRRFYLTLVIYELWKTNNLVWKVSNEFQLDRGFIQQIVQSAASFSNGVMHFCENIDEFWVYKNLLQEFIKRLQYNCSSVDLIPLLELDSVRSSRAKQLFAAGYKTLHDVAVADENDMISKIRMLTLPIAKKIIKSAKILKEKAEVLQAEAENLLSEINLN